MRGELLTTIQQANWLYLRILNSSRGKQSKVEFVAGYFMDGEQLEMREHSPFKRYQGDWKYLDDKG